MNILYISNKKKWGGIVSWMQKTAIKLEERNHNVWIISHKDSEFTNNADKRVKLIPKKLGMDFNPIMITWILFFIIKHKIDLIVTNIKKEVIIGGIAAKIARIPNIRRIGSEKDYDNPMMKHFYNLIDFTITPCKYMVNFILDHKYFVKPNQITHVYNGRNTANFTPKEINYYKNKFDIPTNKIILGVTCQFSETKNICGLLEVFDRLNTKYKNLHLVIAGAGPRKDAIKTKIQNLDLEKSVTFPGFVKNTLQISSTYDIGILFSYMEGFSNSVVEYMAVGTPVVCTDVGGQYEIVQNNYNGFLIAPGNKNQLYEKLSILINDKEKRQKFSKNCIQTIKNKFSEDIMLDKLEKIYKKYAY